LCATCSETAPETCTSCQPGFYLNSGECLRCDTNCLTCSGSGSSSCTSCKVGFYPLSGVCTACIENCISCSPSATNTNLCNTCQLGYVYNPTLKVCVKCINGCTHCRSDKINFCDKCSNGFEPVFTNGIITSCKACPFNCKTCLAGVCL